MSCGQSFRFRRAGELFEIRITPVRGIITYSLKITTINRVDGTWSEEVYDREDLETGLEWVLEAAHTYEMQLLVSVQEPGGDAAVHSTLWFDGAAKYDQDCPVDFGIACRWLVSVRKGAS